MANLLAPELIQPQNFDIRYGKSWKRIIYNLKTAAGRDIWTVKVHSKSLEFMSVDGILLGSANYHMLSNDVDISIPGCKEFTMSRDKGLWSTTKSFTFQNDKFTWKRMGNWKNSGLYNLVDERENVLATVGHDDWKVHSRLELVMPGMNQDLVLAILVTGMAELEAQRRLAGAASASSVNAGIAAVTT